MGLFYTTEATPTSAFFEGLVRGFDFRLFDWISLVYALLRRKRGTSLESTDNSERRERLVEAYVLMSIAEFEKGEAAVSAVESFALRRNSFAADALLGAMPTYGVVRHYEHLAPGARDRIVDEANARMEAVADAEFEHFAWMLSRGYSGILLGVGVSVLLWMSALALAFVNLLWEGIAVFAAYIILCTCSTFYVSLTGVRDERFTGKFFPAALFARNRPVLDNLTDSGVGTSKAKDKRRPLK